MSHKRANDLALLCTDAVRKGNDFPNNWNTLLKKHPLVEGIPRQRVEGNQQRHAAISQARHSPHEMVAISFR
jgi:hypothetical protein